MRPPDRSIVFSLDSSQLESLQELYGADGLDIDLGLMGGRWLC